MFILTVRNDRLGDLILALPTLRALRDAYPDARLGVVASEYAAPVLNLYPDDIEVWPDTDAGRTRLAEDRPDTMLFLYPDKKWAESAYRARIEQRIGTRYRLHSWRFNIRVPIHRKTNQAHEAAYNLMIGEPLLGEIALIPPALEVDEPTMAETRALLADHDITPDQPYVVLHPGSKGSALDWPAERFQSLASQLAAEQYQVVLTGSVAEQSTCIAVAGEHGHSLAGATDIPTLAGVLRGAATLIAGSTGPLHLAAAVGTPTIALFSPHHSHSPRRWGPLGDQHFILQPPVPPCRCKTGKCEYDGCMALLEPEVVAAAVGKVIHGPEVAS